MSKIQPLADRVLIKAASAPEKTVGGIIIPDDPKEKPMRGEVIAVGNGTKDEPMEIKVGEKVIFSQFGGTDIELDGEKFTLMNQSDILAVIE